MAIYNSIFIEFLTNRGGKFNKNPFHEITLGGSYYTPIEFSSKIMQYKKKAGKTNSKMLLKIHFLWFV